MTTEDFSMDREKDEKGDLSVATRRVTTENTLFSDFRETRKDQSGVLAVPPKQGMEQKSEREVSRKAVPMVDKV